MWKWWKGVKGCERVWKRVEGCGRVWPYLEEAARVEAMLDRECLARAFECVGAGGDAADARARLRVVLIRGRTKEEVIDHSKSDGAHATVDAVPRGHRAEAREGLAPRGLLRLLVHPKEPPAVVDGAAHEPRVVGREAQKDGTACAYLHPGSTR